MLFLKVERNLLPRLALAKSLYFFPPLCNLERKHMNKPRKKREKIWSAKQKQSSSRLSRPRRKPCRKLKARGLRPLLRSSRPLLRRVSLTRNTRKGRVNRPNNLKRYAP